MQETPNGNAIQYVGEARLKAGVANYDDIHEIALGRSVEGYHWALNLRSVPWQEIGPPKWSEAHATLGEAMTEGERFYKAAIASIDAVAPPVNVAPGASEERHLSEKPAVESIKGMAEIPDHIKQLADAAVQKAGAEKTNVTDIKTKEMPDWTDAKALEAQQAQKRLDAQREKETPEPPKGPDKG